MKPTLSRAFRYLGPLFFLCATVLMAGGRGGTSDYKPNDVTNGGSIKGTITFAGELPKNSATDVTKDKKICGKQQPDQSLVVNPGNKGIQYAVVYLKKVKSGKAWNLVPSELTIDQKGCRFTPHVLVVPAGQEFNVLNNDGILHNIHTRSEVNREINKAQPKFLKKVKVAFTEPEFVKISCDVHNWMKGWVVVAANPYYAISDENGQFELSDVPAGKYIAEVWQEKLGVQKKRVEVTANGVSTVDVVLQ